MSHSDEESRFDVDICATLLTKTPPRLPLREEIPSLGFEVIYKAAGVGVKASKHEAHKAARAYQRQQEVKELKKRRIFPKSSKRIKETLEKRKHVILELQHSPRALSYEAYERELLKGNSVDTGSSSGGSSSLEASTEFPGSASNVQKYRSRLATKQWGLLRRKTRTMRSKNNVNGESPPSSVKVANTIEGIIGQDIFPDFLAPFDKLAGSHTAASTTPRSNSQAHFSISSPQSEQMEMRFEVSPSTMPYLPGLQAVQEVGEKGPQDFDLIFEQAYSAMDDQLELEQVPTTASSRDPSSITAPIGTRNSRINVVKAPGLYFPGLKVDEDSEASPEGISEVFKDAFAGKKPHQTGLNALEDSVRKAFASFDSMNDVYIEDGGSQHDEGIVDKATKGKQGGIKLEDNVVQAFANVELEDKADDAWLGLARAAFENMTADLFKVMGIGGEEKESSNAIESKLWQDENTLLPMSSDVGLHNVKGGLSPVTSDVGSIGGLFVSISKVTVLTEDIRSILEDSPEFAQIRRQEDGRLLLHALSDRGMPDRSSLEPNMISQLLLKDIADFKDLVVLIQSIYPDACLASDLKGDLPVHLIARAFTQWEAGWYETVYKEAAKQGEKSTENAQVITTLYRTMSECVELLLRPLANERSLCRNPGSVGTILPLHIAVIFTASVPTLRMILEAFPEASKIPCNLGMLKSFVPHNALPLELHDTLSTDFPKWEIEAKEDSSPEIKWSQSKSGRRDVVEDCTRRSDLLFAYNPIEPYCSEKARLRRLESRLQFEAKLVIENDSKRLSRASEILWIWFCTSRDPATDTARYARSVRKIVEGLPLRSLRFLASVEMNGGEFVLDAAAPPCSDIIRQSLDHVVESIVPISVDSTQGSALDCGEKSKASSSVLKTWDETQNTRLSFFEKGLTGHLCDLIFNIQDVPHPKSFIILPYKLSMSNDGHMGIESVESASAAILFADHLLQLTSPRAILYFLDCKSRKHFGDSLFEDDDDSQRLSSYETVKEQEEALLSLYKRGAAYLYLVDELSGMPCLPDADTNYPIILSDADNLVKKVLPLMLTGMLQMRGEKALSVLVSVLLDDSLSVIPEKWMDAAREIRAFLYSQKSKEIQLSTGTSVTTNDLMGFLSTSKGKLVKRDSPKNGSTEWNVELTILRMLLDMNDPDHRFSGLVRRGAVQGRTFWTTSVVESDTLDVGKSRSSPAAKPDGIQKNGKSGPVDLDKMEKMMENRSTDPVDLDNILDLVEKQRLEKRRTTGPVDLDDSINTDDLSSEPSIVKLLNKHTELAKLHAQLKYDPEYSERLDPPQPHDDESAVCQHQKPLRIVRSVYSDDDSQDGASDDGGALRDSGDSKDKLSGNNSSDNSKAASNDERMPWRAYIGDSDIGLGKEVVLQSTDSDHSKEKSSDEGVRRRTYIGDCREASEGGSRDEDGSGSLSLQLSPTLVAVDSFISPQFPMDETVSAGKHSQFSLLFDDLAIATVNEEREEQREPNQHQARGRDEGERVWNDVMGRLEHPMAVWEDIRLLQLKVQLAGEAEKLSMLSKRTCALEEGEQRSSLERKGLVQDSASEWPKNGLNSAAASRRLLLRLSGLEDRILADQIELQHASLETYAVRKELNAILKPLGSTSSSVASKSNLSEVPNIKEGKDQSQTLTVGDTIVESKEQILQRRVRALNHHVSFKTAPPQTTDSSSHGHPIANESSSTGSMQSMASQDNTRMPLPPGIMPVPSPPPNEWVDRRVIDPFRASQSSSCKSSNESSGLPSSITFGLGEDNNNSNNGEELDSSQENGSYAWSVQRLEI